LEGEEEHGDGGGEEQQAWAVYAFEFGADRVLLLWGGVEVDEEEEEDGACAAYGEL